MISSTKARTRVRRNSNDRSDNTIESVGMVKLYAKAGVHGLLDSRWAVSYIRECVTRAPIACEGGGVSTTHGGCGVRSVQPEGGAFFWKGLVVVEGDAR
jgi:hypothetical protein